MPNGSNCALVHDILNSYSGVYLKQNNCYKCANDMLEIHYVGCIREWQ